MIFSCYFFSDNLNRINKTCNMFWIVIFFFDLNLASNRVCKCSLINCVTLWLNVFPEDLILFSLSDCYMCFQKKTMALEKYIIPVVNCDEDWLILTGQKATLTRFESNNRISNFVVVIFSNSTYKAETFKKVTFKFENVFFV